jgi:regulatory protein
MLLPAQALNSQAKRSNRRVIRKGRPVSNAGRDADGPRDGDPSDLTGSLGSPESSFDPFESFDAHDQASGRASSARRGSALAGPSGNTDTAGSPAETTYTRSRRTPGEARGGAHDKSGPDQDRAAKSKGPGRSLKGRALGYLSRREYSRAELSRKLMPFVEEADSLDTLLDSLEKEGWLSDSRFAESLIHRRASRLGASRIVGELKRHAVGQTLIEEASAQLRETELTRAQAVWSKKYGQLPETPAERARQARFLAARGFSGATIGKILKGLDDEWSGD